MPVQGIVLGLKACRIPDPAVPVLPLIPFSSLVIMTDCRYCNKPSSDGDVDGIHKACQDEFNRRHWADLCVRCGKIEAARGSPYCIECRDNDQTRTYEGYPGP